MPRSRAAVSRGILVLSFGAVLPVSHKSSSLAALSHVAANYVSKPTADSSSHSSHAVVRGGLTRR